MRGAATIGCCVAISTACGSEPIAQEELGEVCGQEGPFRVLELAADQQLVYGSPLRIGDRLVFQVHRVKPGDGVASFPETSDPEVWSTGLCGESPVRLAEGFSEVFTIDKWPDVLLACMQETGEIVSLDPLGVAEPHLVFSGSPDTYGCALRWTDHGLLSMVPHDEDFGALMLSQYPENPRTQTVEPETLLDPVRITRTNVGGSGRVAHSIRTFADFVLAIDGEDALVRVELADRSVTTLREEVRGIEASSDGRYLMWQDLAVTGGYESTPEGQTFLRDLTTGDDALLGNTSLYYNWLTLWYTKLGVVQFAKSWREDDPVKIFFLPELQSIEVPSELHFVTRLDDGRWVGGPRFESSYEVMDLKKGESRRLFPRPAQITAFEEDGLVVFEAQQCCIDGHPFDEGPLWRVPYDGKPKKLGERASRFTQRLADGRFLSQVGIGSNWLGTLIVIDPSTREERRIDDHVGARSLSTWWGAEDGLISYSVSDGERSGVYVARLPQHGRSGALAGKSREGVVFDMVPDAEGRPMPVPRELGAH